MYMLYSITVQYRFVCRYRGKDRHIRWLLALTCLGTASRETANCTLDPRQTTHLPAFSAGYLHIPSARFPSLIFSAVLHIDASLDWMQVDAGQVLWRPEDVSDSFYIVINGRLRAITESKDGGVTIVGEYGQGDTVGELDVITSSPRRNTVHAIRDTELVRMPQTLFNAISAR